MSYITRVGNLARTPELRTNDDGRAYCFARVLVTDAKPDKDGTWHDTATTAYDLTITGDQAKRLIATSQESGNIRVLFTGRYRVETYTRPDGSTAISHRVKVDNIGASLKGQTLTITKTNEPTPPADPDDLWLDPQAPF